MTFHAFAAAGAKASLMPFDYEPAPLGAGDVEIAIDCCGICHSDVHLVDDDWKGGRYPLVPGHEIVGRVTEAGEAVRGLTEGTRVGVGWQRTSCGACRHCLRGEENLCRGQEATCAGHFGGFADRIRIDARFAFPLPDALDAEATAPLLCGGATVYAPLRRYVREPGTRVGVIGIGGLGHLGLLFAKALGAEVTAFSRRADKEAEARGFGATGFVATDDKKALDACRGRFDLLLCTAHASLEWGRLLRALDANGVLCLVASPGEPVSFNGGLLLERQRSIAGSVIAGRADIQAMLELAAHNRIGATIERFPFERVNDALERTRRNEARYRTVLTRIGR